MQTVNYFGLASWQNAGNNAVIVSPDEFLQKWERNLLSPDEARQTATQRAKAANFSEHNGAFIITTNGKFNEIAQIIIDARKN